MVIKDIELMLLCGMKMDVEGINFYSLIQTCASLLMDYMVKAALEKSPVQGLPTLPEAMGPIMCGRCQFGRAKQFVTVSAHGAFRHVFVHVPSYFPHSTLLNFIPWQSVRI